MKSVEESWVHRGPGWPTKGFFSDRGKEFDNREFREYARKLGISLKITAPYAPWANGGNEHNHYTVDRAVSKILEEDPNTDLVDAVNKDFFG